MEPGASERDPAEGRLVLKPRAERAGTQQVEHRIERWVTWTRTIVVEGPESWVEKSRLSALADGIHQARSDGGTVHVETTGLDITRFHTPPASNTVLQKLHDTDPDGYDAIHGDGMAARVTESQTQPTTIQPAANGGYI